MQTHEFDHIPVRCGDIVVARFSGQVTWRLKDDGTLLTVNELHLKGERGEIVEILPTEELWTTVVDALRIHAKSSPQRVSAREEIPVSSEEYDPQRNPDLDNAVTEGSRS